MCATVKELKQLIFICLINLCYLFPNWKLAERAQLLLINFEPGPTTNWISAAHNCQGGRIGGQLKIQREGFKPLLTRVVNNSNNNSRYITLTECRAHRSGGASSGVHRTGR